MVNEVGRYRYHSTAISEIITIVILLSFILIFSVHHKFTPSEPAIVKTIDDYSPTFIPPIVNHPNDPPKPPEVKIPVAAGMDEDFPEDDGYTFPNIEYDPSDIPAPPPPIHISDLDDTIEPVGFYVVESQPKMIGGLKSLYSKLNYPSMARRAGKSGDVTLKFICDKEGRATAIKILSERPKGLGFGAAAIDALKRCRFKPGMQRDKAVPVSMNLPISFKVK